MDGNLVTSRQPADIPAFMRARTLSLFPRRLTHIKCSHRDCGLAIVISLYGKEMQGGSPPDVHLCKGLRDPVLH